MKQFWLCSIIYFVIGIHVVPALDQIIFKDGTHFKAKVIEVTPSSIKYQYPDIYGEQMFFIHVGNIHSIKYEDGRIEKIIFNDRANDEKTIIGVNTNAGGAIPGGLIPGLNDTTPSINIEFTNGNFNSEINIIISNIETISSGIWGFGILSVFNYLWEIPFGAIYIGGGAGYLYKSILQSDIHDIMLGGNINFRYPFSIGMYLRAGVFVGGRLSFNNGEIDKEKIFYFRPDIGVGYSF